jgi:hypothetical protein
MAIAHWSLARLSTPQSAIWQAIERRRDDVHYDRFEILYRKGENLSIGP